MNNNKNTCRTCNGNGTLTTHNQPCPRCNGTGKPNDQQKQTTLQ